MSSSSFSQAASSYDQDFTFTAIGEAQRACVWQTLLKRSVANKKILELNAGTGEDAKRFLEHDCEHIVVTDVAEGMLEQARHKLQSFDRLAFQQLNLQAPELQEKQIFDIVFSNFGGLNCVPPEKMSRLFEFLNIHSHEQTRIILVVMGRNSLWDKFYMCIKGKFSQINRRTKMVDQVNLNGKAVDTYFYAPEQLKHHASLHFKAINIQPIGFLVPPSYMNPFFAKHPRILNLLINLDRKMPWRLLADYADHYYIEFIKK